MKSDKIRVVRDFAKFVSPGKAELYEKYDMILIPARRGGVYIYDVEGKDFINCHSNGGVFNLGHRNKRIIKAVSRAMENFDIGNHHLISLPRTECGRMLAGTMPAGLNQVIYGVSGGEAVDVAIKLARGVTGRKEIISAKGCYHGHTGFALATGDKKYSEKFKPMAPGFKQIPFNNIDHLKKTISKDTAALIFETIPATMGIVVPDAEYFQVARELCDKHGVLLILDEIQTGFGRTGKFWGFQHFGIIPDVVTMGKGMSGGIYPISATVYHEKYAYFFKEDPFVHISTFGGSEIGCFAAMEMIQVTTDKEFMKNIKTVGNFFQKEFKKLSKDFPKLKLGIRGLGLMLGLEFKDESTALLLVKHFFDNGLYVVYSGNDPKVIQFLPPLVITIEEAEEVMNRMRQAFTAMEGK